MIPDESAAITSYVPPYGPTSVQLSERDSCATHCGGSDASAMIDVRMRKWYFTRSVSLLHNENWHGRALCSVAELDGVVTRCNAGEVDSRHIGVARSQCHFRLTNEPTYARKV